MEMQTFCLRFEKQYGRHSNCFENHKDALNLEILQLASSNLHKRYMARKASHNNNFCLVSNQNDRHITCLMSNGVILLKGPYISSTISECENIL